MPQISRAGERKILAGPRLKRLRRERGLTQARMAEELAMSPSYLNLIERNQRPITLPVLARLTDVYGIDPREFMEDGADDAVQGLERVLADPLFRDTPVARAELRDAVEYAPWLAAAMRRLFDAYTAAQARDEPRLALKTDPDRAETGGSDSPTERVRAILQEQHNHFPEVDALAETFASDLALDGGDLFQVMAERLRGRHGIRVRVLPVELMGDKPHRYDLHQRQLLISELLDSSGRGFQAAYQLAISEHGSLLNATCARLEPRDDEARRRLRVVLANYFAGAVMMPYARFRDAAEAVGYDLDVLAARFGASFEQVAHRLTTLGRPTARGIPFFLLRVDRAGNVSKRFSGRRSPFSQAGGTCALWSLHGAFEAPGHTLTEVVELPDGEQWLTLSRMVGRPARPHGAITPCFALAVGCEVKYAHRFVYARGLERTAATPIGLSCRLCERPACPQRAAPPVGGYRPVDIIRTSPLVS